tara:strand:- start:161 stop:454 length:294 start_codon:yes stop_codon:yes gene_type:complete
MRQAYILPTDIDSSRSSARGGVGSNCDDAFQYDLEIGQMMNCDTRMLALAAHIDEVRALFATLKDDPLAVLVKKSWDELTDKLDKQLKEAKEMEKSA